MQRNTLALLATLLATAGAQAGIALGSAASTYSESFNSLAATPTNTNIAWANDSTLAGWSIFTLTNASVTTYRAGTGSANTGAAYSFGLDSDRALGGVGSAGFSGYFALALDNTSSTAFNSFTLRFDGEQWRDGGNPTPVPQSMLLEYGFGSSFAAVGTWTPLGGSFVFTSPVFNAAGAAVNGNTAGLVANLGGTVAVNWNPGETLWLRWIDINNTGNDHGLAIDNVSFSVTAVPEPSSYALMLAGLGAIGFLARRRRA